MKTEIEISGITAEVKVHGNSCHVILPKSWLGKKVRITSIEEDEEAPIKSRRNK
jgi:putative transposon-encoded protein